MSREKLKEYLSTNKDKLVRISCHSAGVIVMCVVLRRAIKNRNNYIVTDLVVSDLGKLGERLIDELKGQNINIKYIIDKNKNIIVSAKTLVISYIGMQTQVGGD